MYCTQVDVITGTGWLEASVTLIAIFVAGMVYLLPFIVAQTRRASNVGAVFAVNVLFGWSIFGWIVALVLVLKSNTRPSVRSA